MTGLTQEPARRVPVVSNGLPDRAPHALVYVPGLDLGLTKDKTVRGVVTRLQTACNHQARTRPATFRVHWYDAALDDKAPSTDTVATVLRKDGDDEQPVIDVFRYSWSGQFVERWQAQNLFRRAGRAVLSLTGAPAFYRFFRTAGKKTPLGRAQLLTALVMIVVMVLYTVVLLFAVVQTAWRVFDRETTVDGRPTTTTTSPPAQPGTTPPPSAGEDGEEGGPFTAQRVAILGAAVAAAAPKVRRRIEDLGGALFAADGYLRVAHDKTAIVGGLAGLIEALSERGYKDVAIVAYSFGSIVALDTLYPTTGEPVRSMEVVRNLVTIGSPFDFARAVRKHWTENRHARTGVPETWLNIYSPIDLLGSNFRAERAQADNRDGTIAIASAPPSAVVKPTNHRWDLGIEPRVTNIVAFHGFSSHGEYWGSDRRSDSNVFEEVVKHLYDREGSPVLV